MRLDELPGVRDGRLEDPFVLAQIRDERWLRSRDYLREARRRLGNCQLQFTEDFPSEKTGGNDRGVKTTRPSRYGGLRWRPHFGGPCRRRKE